MEKNSSNSETDASIYLPSTSKHQTPNCYTKRIKIEDSPYVEDASLNGRVESPCSDLMEQVITISQNSQESEISAEYNRISLSQDYFADESCSVDENINNNIQGHARHNILEIDQTPSHPILDPSDSVFNDDDIPSNTIRLFSSLSKFSSDLDSKSTKPRISLCMPDLSTDLIEIQPSNKLPQKISAFANSNSKKEDHNKSQSNSDLPKITSEIRNRGSCDVSTSSCCSADIKVTDDSSSTSFQSNLSLEQHVILLPHKKQKESSSLASGPSREERRVDSQEFRNVQECTDRINPEENYTIFNFHINTLEKNKRLAKSRRGKSDKSSSFSRKRTYSCGQDYYEKNKNTKRTNGKPFQATRIDRKLKMTPIQQNGSLCLRYVRDILDNNDLDEKSQLNLIKRLLSILEETTTDTD